jgi:methionyl-tRNA formyltransferase
MALQALARAGANLVGLVAPSNRSGPDVELVRSVAASHGLPLLFQPPRARIDSFVREIQALDPAVIFVWSYSMILPPAVIAVPPLGCVNMHGGILPEYRGGHVMQWAIINGERETGVTLHYIDEGVDTGPIIASARVPITWGDDAVTVREKLEVAGAGLLQEWWPAIAAGTAPRTRQDESRARYYRLRTADDGLIDWSASAGHIYHLVRALVAPWPGAFTFIGERKLVVRRAAVAKETLGGCAPGVVSVVSDEGLRIGTGDGELLVHQVEMDGSTVARGEWTAVGLTHGARLGARHGASAASQTT